MSHCVTCFTALLSHEEPLKQCRECYQKNELSAARAAEAEAVKAGIAYLRWISGDGPSEPDHSLTACDFVGRIDAARAERMRLENEP